MNAKTNTVKLSCESINCDKKEFEVTHAERLLNMVNNGGWFLDDEDYEVKDGNILRRIKKENNGTQKGVGKK